VKASNLLTNLLAAVCIGVFAAPAGFCEKPNRPLTGCKSSILQALKARLHISSEPSAKAKLENFLGISLNRKQTQAIQEAMLLKPSEAERISMVDAGRQDTLLRTVGYTPDQILNLRLGGYLGEVEPPTGAIPLKGFEVKAAPLQELKGDVVGRLLKAGRELEELRRQERVALKKGNAKKLAELRSKIAELEPQLEMRYFAGRNGIQIASRDAAVPEQGQIWLLKNSTQPNVEPFVVTEAGTLRYDPGLEKKQIFFQRESGVNLSFDEFNELARRTEKKNPGLRITRRWGRAEPDAFRTLDCTQGIHRDMRGYGMLRDAFITRNSVDVGVRFVMETTNSLTNNLAKKPHFWTDPTLASTAVLDTIYGQIMTGGEGKIRQLTSIGDFSPSTALLWRFAVGQGLKSLAQDNFYTYGLLLLPPIFAPFYNEDPAKYSQKEKAPAPSASSSSKGAADLVDYFVYGTATDPFARAQNAYNEKFLIGGTVWGYLFDKAVLNQMIPLFYDACLSGKLTKIMFNNATTIRLINGVAMTSLYFGLRPTPEGAKAASEAKAKTK